MGGFNWGREAWLALPGLHQLPFNSISTDPFLKFRRSANFVKIWKIVRRILKLQKCVRVGLDWQNPSLRAERSLLSPGRIMVPNVGASKEKKKKKRKKKYKKKYKKKKECEIATFFSAPVSPTTVPFVIVENHDEEMGKFFVVQECRTTDFKALKL